MIKKNTEKKISARSEHFKKIRARRTLAIAEDYTELVADLIETKGNVKVCDIAQNMGVSHVSVLRTLKRLVRDGYLTYDALRCIELTQKGKEVAVFSKQKHLVLTEFFLRLGVPGHIVATDVEGIEHYISPTTLEALIAHMCTF